MTACAICLGDDPDEGLYHGRCLEGLFGAALVPDLDFDLTSFPAEVRATHDQISVSGVQRKALVTLSADRRALVLADRGASLYILKPQTERYPNVPENEHLTMRIAGELGLLVPPLGLFRLRDGTWAYLVRRFDRTGDHPPRKRQQFDFCQLLSRSPERKADGHAEECAELVRRHTADPSGSLRRLFQLFVASFWLGNGDLHLKNLSLLADHAGRYDLSPAYDLLNTTLYKIHSQLLAISGRRDDVTRAHFLRFGTGACGLAPDLAGAIIDAICSAQERAAELVDRSFLPAQHKAPYKQALAKRTRALQIPA